MPGFDVRSPRAQLSCRTQASYTSVTLLKPQTQPVPGLTPSVTDLIVLQCNVGDRGVVLQGLRQCLVKGDRRLQASYQLRPLLENLPFLLTHRRLSDGSSRERLASNVFKCLRLAFSLNRHCQQSFPAALCFYAASWLTPRKIWPLCQSKILALWCLRSARHAVKAKQCS